MSLSIAGAGYAYPDTVISNQFLSELDPELTPEKIFSVYGVTERRTTLPLESIRSTKNADPYKRMYEATVSPTELGYLAAKMALERAGITIDKVGLIMAECLTPYETTPAESQRIGSKLGVKIPAYDIISGSGILPSHVDVLNRWKPERLPPYVLCVSTHAPTQRTDYRSGPERLLIGDGASALVISTKGEGRLSINEIGASREPAPGTEVVIDIYGHIKFTPVLDLDKAVEQGYSTIKGLSSISAPNSKLIAAYFDVVSIDRLGSRLGLDPSNIWTSVGKRGFSLGASPLMALAERWDEIRQGDVLTLLSAPGAQSGGYVVLKSNN